MFMEVLRSTEAPLVAGRKVTASEIGKQSRAPWFASLRQTWHLSGALKFPVRGVKLKTGDDYRCENLVT
jgi:hypothetical protein